MNRFTPAYRTLAFLTSALGIAVAYGCGSSGGPSEFNDGTGGGTTAGSTAGSTAGPGTTGGTTGEPIFGTTGGGTGAPSRPCEGLECQQVSCEGGGTTSLSGTVLDPSGTVPLYNAIVYVPNAPVDPFPQGNVTCDRCGTVPSGKPIATALTDAAGKFTLKNVPVGNDIPVVIQIGRWRRQIRVPGVPRCTDTPLAAAETRLPRTKAEGDIPRIAVTTGGADSLECFFRKLLGESVEEITNPSGPGRVHLYQGLRRPNEYKQRCNRWSGNPQTADNCTRWVDDNDCGGSQICRTVYPVADGVKIDNDTPPATSLWGSAGGTAQAGKPHTVSWPAATSKLMNYDMVVLSCEGSENLITKEPAAREALGAYLDAGGRVFASHYHYTWIKNSATLGGLANWGSEGIEGDATVRVDTSFPRGSDFADWLVNVNASPPADGGRSFVKMIQLRDHVNSLNAGARQWIYDTTATDGTGTPQTPKYFSFNTPITAGADAQCGRGVYTDIHVSSGDGSTGLFPANCTSSGLTAQEKALLFLLMDLSACVQDDTRPPAPPPPIIR